jgi:CPA2 family monovalent cation:H+ antiporter-2
MRILVRTPYVAEVEALAAVGVDRVIAEELESVVQLFTDVMRAYAVDTGEILGHEEHIRRAGYAALRRLGQPAQPAAECTLGPDCLDRRTVLVRAGAPAVGQPLAGLDLERRFAIRVEGVRRHGTRYDAPAAEIVIAPGDELALAGAADAFAQAAPLFRVGTPSQAEAAALASAAARRRVDTTQSVTLWPRPGAACAHLDRINTVRPRTPGCEECLRDGTRWVHLRVCMSCGHVGCCDSSPLQHATGHWHATQHPIMRSLEPGETWGWCYAEQVEL